MRIVFVILVLLVTVVPVFAYIDPGTGSMFMQVIIGGVLGVFFLLKLRWKQIISFFNRKNGQDTHDVEKT